MWILIVPILLPLLMIAGIVCLVIGAWIIGTFFILIAFFLNERTQTFAYKGLFRSKQCLSSSRTLKVLNYNVNNWHYFEYKGESAIDAFINFLKQENADIICFEEHTFIERYDIENRLKEIYPYTSGQHDVYSKYPIANHRKICLSDDDIRIKSFPDFLRLVGPNWREMPIWTMEVDVNGFMVHLIDCYMMTNNFNRVKYDLEGESYWNRYLLTPLKIYTYIRFGYKARALGAEVLRKEIDRFDGPTIILGDFNDLSGSYCLRNVMGTSLQNAWWRCGLGFGFTFCTQGMRWRLDHVLCSTEFDVKDVRIPLIPFSDHYPVVADLKFISD